MVTPFLRHRGKAVALPRRDVDTDQIIPKQFLKGVERTGFGPSLFYDWRADPDWTPDFEQYWSFARHPQYGWVLDEIQQREEADYHLKAKIVSEDDGSHKPRPKPTTPESEKPPAEGVEE